MFNFVGSVIGNNGAKFLADFFAVIFGAVGHAVSNALMSVFVFIWNAITKYVWFICKWILGFIDVMQFAFTRILGLNLNDGTSLSLADYIKGLQNITISGGASYYDRILKIFRAVFGAAIVLMIIFTIVAMVIQEYNLAVSGYQKADNQKGKFVMTLFKNVISIFLIPLIFYTIIIGTNSILTSFYRALGGYSDTTIAGNALAAATYDANRYRAYANANKRIPITISVYSMENQFGNPKTDEELKEQIQDEEVQLQLKAIAGAFANDSFLPFEKSTAYANGMWSNYKNYSITYDNTVYDDMGQYFENFICTREQYYVLADFIDYCQLHNIKYYVKAISESDISWKYVDGISLTQPLNADGTANGDVFLDVTYRDAEKVNNPSEFVDYASASSPSSDNEYKTLQLTTKLDMTSPIADALKTASTLLGINETDSSFNVMERDDSGDFVNLVQWANRKVKLKLSDDFDLTDPDEWLFSDQIIVYEYFRFQNDFGSSNNDLEDYTIEELKTQGALVEALEMTYRNYNSNTETYSKEKTLYCVRLNGNYYRVVESTTDFDDYGHAYFELDVAVKSEDYFEDATITIEKEGDAELELSSSFDINNKTDWTFSDEVLVYEYFKDLSLSNGLRRSYKFTDFDYDDVDDDGPMFPYYTIKNGASESKYLYVNGTYYECDDSGALVAGAVTDFLVDTSAAGVRWFGYRLDDLTEENYGINALSSLLVDSVSSPVEVEQNDAMFERYSSMNMKLSQGFSFYNTDTWTFRDYAIMYLYINKILSPGKVVKNITIQSLQSVGFEGDIVRKNNEYYLRVVIYETAGGTTDDRIVYIDLNDFEKTSEQRITKIISSEQFDELNLGTPAMNFVQLFNASTDVMLNKPVSSKYFEMSENFDQYDPQTWSIGDYLMLYLIDKAYINTTIDLIKVLGYTALCYEAGTAENPENYYRFGVGENAFYLNESKINKMGYTVEKWFKTNLLSFLLSARYGDLGRTDITIGSDFADGTVANADSYLFNIDENFSNSDNLQYILAENFLNYGDVITDISEIEYSYYNPKIDENDIATWNYIDTIVYIKTGLLPTEDDPFVSYLFFKDDIVYLQVSDGFVPINDAGTSGTRCYYEDANRNLLTQMINSKTTKMFVGDDAKLNFRDYYDSRLKSTVVSLEDAVNGVDELGLTPIFDILYYTPYYNQTYWKSTGGSWDASGTVAPGFIKNAAMTEFDIILASLEVPVSSISGYYTFDAFRQDSTGDLYIKPSSDNNYIKLSTSDESSIFVQSNILLPNQGTAFAANGDYTPSKTGYKMYDAVIYSIDKTFATSNEEATYKKYTFNAKNGADNSYLYVNGKIVKFDDSLTETVNLDSVLSPEKITFLYENYYNQYVSTSAPSARAEYSFNSVAYGAENFVLNPEYIKNFSGLSLILKYFEVTNLDSCYIIDGITGYYLNIGGKYINLSKLGLLKDPIEKQSSGNVSRIFLSFADSHVEEFRWVLARVKVSASLSFVTAEMLQDAGIKVDYFKILEESKLSEVSWRNSRESITILPADPESIDNSVKNWTWLGLILSYVDPGGVYTDVDIRYHYDNDGVGKMYYVIRNAISTYVVPHVLSSGGNSYNLIDTIANSSATGKTYNQAEFNVTSSQKLGLILSNLGFAVPSVIMKFKSNYFVDNTVSPSVDIYNFYVVTRNEGGVDKYYAIFDLRGAEEAVSGSGVKYVKEDESAPSGFTTTTIESEAPLFIITSKPLSELSEWSTIDFIVSCATNTIDAQTFASKVYVYNEQYYVYYDEQFILIPHLSEYGLFDASGSDCKIVKETYTGMIDMLMFIQYKNTDNTTDSIRPIYKYNAATTPSALKIKLDAFENELTNPANQILEQSQAKFSENFKLNDFKSWTIADYVIYYTFTSQFYAYKDNGGDLIEECYDDANFTYVPKFSKSGDVFYGLTHLDIVMTEIEGTDYLNSANVYNFTLCRDDNYKYYLKYKGHFIPVSADIYVDFDVMETMSNKLNMNLNLADILAKCDEYTDTNTEYYNGTSINGETAIQNYFSANNFQTFVNANYAPIDIGYLIKMNPDTGSVSTAKVMNFKFREAEYDDERIVFDYDEFLSFYSDYISSYLITDDSYELEVKIANNKANLGIVTHNMSIEMVYDEIYPDLTFDNYYYFNFDAEKLLASNLMNVGDEFKTPIKTGNLTGTAIQRKAVNLRLNYGVGKFDLVTISNWHVLDFIILYELSRDNVRHNAFKGMTVDELFKTDYYYAAYYVDKNSNGSFNSGVDSVYLYLNNNFYDISNIVTWDEANKVFVSNGKTVSETQFNNKTDTTMSLVGLVSKGSINSYNFKVLDESWELSINPLYNGSVSYTRHKDNISYQVGSVTYFKELDTNIADTNYRINVSLFGTYLVKPLIKKTSWVEKLMTDMQIYYPDLNWGVLLATDGWLDTLGEFTSAHSNGLFVGGQNSANTTAAGLVLSEFFMSVATKVEGGYAEYEYSSVFDKDTIRALMMSLLGEENYQALVFEAEVFMDYFNSCFAPIIDDFAEEFGEDIGQNSLRLNAYKSYLATLLLSSDIGEYLYTIATRVYAEYTINEYLASAAGDYVGYYNYVNQLTDENGEIVDAYSYGSFLDLIIYENEYCGNANPVFTFNFKKAFDKYKNDEGKFYSRTYEDLLADEIFYRVAANDFFKEMDKEYSKIYGAGYDISEHGIVVDSEGNEVSFYRGKTYIYCYMLHVYWEIRTEVNGLAVPSYLRCYRDYLDGNLTRWSIVKEANTETADQYFEHYNSEKSKITLYKGLTVLNSAKLFKPSITLDDNSDHAILKILDLFVELISDPASLGDNVSIPIVTAKKILSHDSQFAKDLDYIMKKSFSIYFIMSFSEDSGFKISEIFKDVLDKLLPGDLSHETCWRTINEYHKKVENVLAELKSVRELLPGETTDRGSSRRISAGLYYTDAQLDKVIGAYADLNNSLTQYISAQTKVDQMQKRSITFTLAQYGSNYVAHGYKLSIKNKEYTFNPSTDPVRLAEYVYGGAFLESVGEGAKYTDPDFTGIVKASKVYDNEDHALKTNLDTWSELRRFLSKIADQTAELYFTTNLSDLDVGLVNAIKINDKIAMTTEAGVLNGRTSIQEELYYYMASGIDRKILYRLTNNVYNTDDPAANTIPAYQESYFASLAGYIFEHEVSDEAYIDMTFEEFKRIAMKKVIDNEQNQDETPEERSAKYMTLFNIMGLQVDLKAGSTQIDRVLNSSQINKSAGAQVVYKANGSGISGTLRISDNTIETIKVLSGLENRPTREVLTRQYEGIRPGNYYDEAYGDIFIACTYENGLYYPILGSASRASNHDFISQYYDNDTNVVVMKGVITANGYPTAIRKYNNPVEVLKKKLFDNTTETYNAVTYYRTDVGVNFGAGEDVIDASRAVGRVTTKNYTKYLYNTSYTKGIGATVTYTGKTNLKTVVSSDYTANFVQSKSEYLIGQADDYGAISVLDEFSYFYLFGGQSFILLMLAFVTIIPVMINACGGAAARMLDIIALFIISPAIIATNSLYPDGKNAIYKKWKKNLETVAMGAFGYIIAFSSYTILIPMIYNVSSFVSVPTYNKIISLGGLGGFLTYPTVNTVVKFLWILTVVSVLEKVPTLVLPIITANRGDLKTPDPGLGEGMGKKFTSKLQDVVKSTTGEFQKIGNLVSGKALMGLAETAKDQLTDMIPGYNIVKGVVESKLGKAKDKRLEKESKEIEAALKAYGYDAKTAKKLGSAVKEADKQKQKAKLDKQKRIEQYKNDFKNLI